MIMTYLKFKEASGDTTTRHHYGEKVEPYSIITEGDVHPTLTNRCSCRADDGAHHQGAETSGKHVRLINTPLNPTFI